MGRPKLADATRFKVPSGTKGQTTRYGRGPPCVTTHPAPRIAKPVARRPHCCAPSRIRNSPTCCSGCSSAGVELLPVTSSRKRSGGQSFRRSRRWLQRKTGQRFRTPERVANAACRPGTEARAGGREFNSQKQRLGRITTPSLRPYTDALRDCGKIENVYRSALRSLSLVRRAGP